jgi:spore maturation protein CgeB
LRIVVIGLSLSSSWGNGHATTYRALLSAFAARGHDILFLERDVAWYSAHRDLPSPDFCRLAFYPDIASLFAWQSKIAAADAVIVGSYVPDGVAVGNWVLAHARGATAFYDIDTPVTLASIARGEEIYLSARQIPSYDVYLSFTGGPTLDVLRETHGAKSAVALYCSVDPTRYQPILHDKTWDLSYLGTYSADRQAGLERLLLEPARRSPQLRCAVAGPQYPSDLVWPENVQRLEHVPPADHAAFYGASRYTLNITRADMIAAGYSPSVRLFEAAACATAIISDLWDGLLTVLGPRDISIAETPDDVLRVLAEPEEARAARGLAAQSRILASHTASHRAAELEAALNSAILSKKATPLRPLTG